MLGTLKKNTSSSELLTLAPYDDSVNYLNVPQGNNNSTHKQGKLFYNQLFLTLNHLE